MKKPQNRKLFSGCCLCILKPYPGYTTHRRKESAACLILDDPVPAEGEPVLRENLEKQVNALGELLAKLK